MATKFYEIVIQLQQNKYFKFTPTEYIYIDSPATRVVIYNISYYDGDDTNSNLMAQIPYYISNGHTNHFRANMLYPFICFSHENSTESCPFDPTHSKLPNGGLMKLSIGKNFNNSEINKWIISELARAKKPNSNEQKYPESLYRVLESTSKNGTVGVMSVLPRIQNILDYFIAIVTEPIINMKNYQNYRPVWTAGQEFNIDYVDSPALPKYYGLQRPESLDPHNFDEYLSIGDFYRSRLTIALNDQIKHFIKYGILNTNEIILEPYQLTMQVFNQTVGICNREPKDSNNISMFSIQNVSVYSLISHNLHQQLITKVESEISSGIADPVRNKFFLTFNLMLIRTPIYNGPDPDSLLPINIRGWNAQCYRQKYLKYKNKYLQLKNKLTNKPN